METELPTPQSREEVDRQCRRFKAWTWVLFIAFAAGLLCVALLRQSFLNSQVNHVQQSHVEQSNEIHAELWAKISELQNRLDAVDDKLPRIWQNVTIEPCQHDAITRSEPSPEIELITALIERHERKQDAVPTIASH